MTEDRNMMDEKGCNKNLYAFDKIQFMEEITQNKIQILAYINNSYLIVIVNCQ